MTATRHEEITLPLSDIKPYKNNPRINDMAVEPLADSMRLSGYDQYILVDENNVILKGHTRWKALSYLDSKHELGAGKLSEVTADRVKVIRVHGLTEKEKKKARIVDNKVAELAEWDPELLAIETADVGIDISDYAIDNNNDGIKRYEQQGVSESGALVERFIVSPFSVLDAKSGPWQDRKREWLKITGDLSETRDGEFGTNINSDLGKIINGGTSNFDPVLAEVMYHWFNVPGGKILDPFGGEQTKGVVAGEMGYEYYAVEIRSDQVELNKEKTKQYGKVHYYCGDSKDISKIVPVDIKYDMCFTSPPYYDLEVYSKEDMSALGTYKEFMDMYEAIFKQCYELLDDDTFLVIKIGEIRDKKTGIYRSFVADNINLFNRIGFNYYNELVLLTALGTAPIRANSNMVARKIAKVHQNVLVFYKGDVKKIPSKYPMMTYEGDKRLEE